MWMVDEGIKLKMNVDNKKISVVTTVYNTPVNWLEDCVNSVINQTYTNLEHVIVDDGSTNIDTIQFLKALSKKDSRIKIIFQERNQGIGTSRNRGIKEASGDYICFLDSDDFYKEEFLENLYKPIRENNSVEMVVDSGFTLVDENKNEIKQKTNSKKIDDLFFYYTMPTGCRLVKKEILIDKCIFYSEQRKIYEDNTFFIAMTIECKHRCKISYKGYVNRINLKSFSHSMLYRAVEYDSIPSEYIQKNILDRSKKIIKHDENKVIISTCLMIYGTIMIFFTRDCKFNTKKEILSKISTGIKKIPSKKYLNLFKLYFNGCKTSLFIRFLFYGLAVSLHLKLEVLYSLLIHNLMNFFLTVKKILN